MNWKELSKQPGLTEAFIIEHERKLKWDLLSRHQTLSLSFILQHIDKIHLEELQKNENIKLSHPEWKQIQETKNPPTTWEQEQKENRQAHIKTMKKAVKLDYLVAFVTFAVFMGAILLFNKHEWTIWLGVKAFAISVLPTIPTWIFLKKDKKKLKELLQTQ